MIEKQLNNTRRIRFTVPGIPVAWHRSGYNRHMGIIFKNKKDTQYQALIKAYAIECRPKMLPEGPIIIELIFLLPKPKHHKEDIFYPHIKKPDCDNLCKNVLDALTGSMWKDDCQIIRQTVAKAFSRNPRLSIQIEYLEYNN
jgi:Holliday junction resolvase RusA-like endonuclease